MERIYLLLLLVINQIWKIVDKSNKAMLKTLLENSELIIFRQVLRQAKMLKRYLDIFLFVSHYLFMLFYLGILQTKTIQKGSGKNDPFGSSNDGWI